MLERCNLTVDTACDGDEAVDLVLDAENSDRAYDLVLMDVQLPCCDGYEATRAIRLAGISHHHLPVIAITARTGPEDIALVRKAGMQAYLTQPIAFAELAAALRRWLPHRVVGEDRDANPRPENKASLEERWRARREQALQATREAAERAAMDEESTVRLAGLMHGLANCAALLGEEDLGRIAGRLEIALRSGADVEIRRRLAHELLQRAGPTLETAP